MKLRRRLLILALVLAAGAAASVWFQFMREQPGAGAMAPAERKGPAQQTAPEELPVRKGIGEGGKDPFSPRQWKAAEPPAAAPPAPKALEPPPMPYRYAGKMVHDGVETHFLAKGNQVVPIRVGETLDGGFRVESIDAQWIVLQTLPRGAQHRIAVTSMLEQGQKR